MECVLEASVAPWGSSPDFAFVSVWGLWGCAQPLPPVFAMGMEPSAPGAATRLDGRVYGGPHTDMEPSRKSNHLALG